MENKYCSIHGTPLVNGTCPQCSYDTYQQQSAPAPRMPRVKNPNTNFFDWLCEFLKSPCAAVYRAVAGKKAVWALIIIGILSIIEPLAYIANITGFSKQLTKAYDINFVSYLRMFSAELVSYAVLVGTMIIVASLMNFRSLDKSGITALCGTALVFKIPVVIISIFLSLCLTPLTNCMIFSAAVTDSIFVAVFSVFATLMTVSLNQDRKAVDCFKLVVITVTIWLILSSIFNYFISGMGIPTKELDAIFEAVKAAK